MRTAPFCLALATLLRAAPGLEITVYNDDLALVKDRRQLELPKGRSLLPWEGVAQTLDASSASFSSPAARVLEQDYRYDLVSRAVLLQKYLGREVTLVEDASADGKVPARERKGKILSLEGERITSFESEGKILLDPPGRVVLPSLPEGLLVKPTLALDLQSPQGGKAEAELRYLCTGLSWKADYVAILDSSNRRIDLDGLVTLSNRSGTNFPDAHLKIVAGAVNRVPQEQLRLRAQPRLAKLDMLEDVAAVGAAAPEFHEEGLLEYHLYDLARPTTLLDNSQKQLSLLAARGAVVKRRYVFDAELPEHYWWWKREDTKAGLKVAVLVDVPNIEDNHLGMPLPQGKIRVYQADKSGSLQFVGEDRIGHTSQGDTLHLALGQAFDVSGTRIVKASSTVKDERTEAVSVLLKNAKDEAVEVEVVEHLPYPDWKLKDASLAFEKRDASTIVFKVSVPARGQAGVEYAYRARL